MAIDFTLTTAQRKLQLEARKFAKELLADARAAELLATPEERFRATKPTYEAMIAAGYLRKCIPASAGGENDERSGGHPFYCGLSDRGDCIQDASQRPYFET